ncbi:hypothetical protein KOR42_17860 [Thalassoglobus neptunius]|uniref:Uncharacterized protein n=2 Tax=Thalassoglobus neptunius TaxID=1938619 RepID=A0A5C5X968_9PLAN|nr:hypothetical protein KOR42_17860 [Thalassoglobus neptunius]
MHQTNTWMWGRTICFGWAGGLFLSVLGCASTSHIDLLEARLREQEVVVDRYEREVEAVREQLITAQRRTAMLEEQLAGTGSQLVSAEVTEQIAAIEGIRFNTLLTGAQDLDSEPGDERLHAMVYPHDGDGDLVKLVGQITFEAIDLSLPENERTVGRWEMNSQEALEYWHNGFLSSGFKFEFPWQSPPAGDEVLLHVKLKAPDGREFRTSHTIKVDPPKFLATVRQSPDLISTPQKPANPPLSPNGVSDPKQPPTDTTDPQQPPTAIDVLDPFPDSEQPVTKAGFATISDDGDSPAPFPQGVQTSDNFRDETIPAYR